MALRNDTLFKYSKNMIKNVYLNSDVPFVIGLSGGKDSTLATQLFFEVLTELDEKQLKNKIYIISADTLVENPPIAKLIHKVLNKIQKKALSGT
jgi:DNA sulfur modification protein DndC